MALLQSLRPGSVYDFSIASPGLIQNAGGELIRLSLRCWIILERTTLEPISFDDAEELLNTELEHRSGKKEILLDRAATEYIVSTTNGALDKAKSVKRLSAAKGSFSLR